MFKYSIVVSKMPPQNFIENHKNVSGLLKKRDIIEIFMISKGNCII